MKTLNKIFTAIFYISLSLIVIGLIVSLISIFGNIFSLAIQRGDIATIIVVSVFLAAIIGAFGMLFTYESYDPRKPTFPSDGADE